MADSIFRRPLWLDCDPGHDDAVALILASHHDSIELIGVSTVHGNQEVSKVTKNALRVLQLCGRSNVDVVQGQSRPLMRMPRPCPEIHGETGLDGPEWGMETKSAIPGKAVNVMFEALWKASKDLQEVKPALVCTGALTNAALLLTVYPEIAGVIDIVVMGGCIGVGNTGPVMEFNIQCDPEAAKIVFDSPAPVTIVPLEVTHTALVTPDILERIRGTKPSHFRRIVVDLLLYFAHTYNLVFGFDHPPLHDPCAVAYVIDPSLFKVESVRVDVETVSELSAGQTVFDFWKQSGKQPNVTLARIMDTNSFWDLVIAAISKADVAIQYN